MKHDMISVSKSALINTITDMVADIYDDVLGTLSDVIVAHMSEEDEFSDTVCAKIRTELGIINSTCGDLMASTIKLNDKSEFNLNTVAHFDAALLKTLFGTPSDFSETLGEAISNASETLLSRQEWEEDISNEIDSLIEESNQNSPDSKEAES